MVDILNENVNKNTFKYTEYIETKKNCFEYIDKSTKETIRKEVESEKHPLDLLLAQSTVRSNIFFFSF